MNERDELIKKAAMFEREKYPYNVAYDVITTHELMADFALSVQSAKNEAETIEQSTYNQLWHEAVEWLIKTDKIDWYRDNMGMLEGDAIRLVDFHLHIQSKNAEPPRKEKGERE